MNKLLPTLVIILALACNGSDDSGIISPDPILPDPDPTVIEPIPCERCSHVISGKTDGTELNIQPGDTICLDGNVEYGDITFININGTAERPVVIKNCDEKVAVINPSDRPFGLKFQRSSYFKLLGNGGGGNYGIKVTTDKGFFITLQTFTTNFEIANVEVAGRTSEGSGFAGIGVKTSPYEDCDAFLNENRSASWLMEDVIIRDNYIHDTGGEGLYIGHGFYNGRTEPQCGVRTYAHSIRGIRVYNNRIENVGLDGIQMKNCDEDVLVYNNVINGYARAREGAHDEGILIGDGTTGKFYNNLIIDGGTGIFVHGMGNCDIYNNVVVNAYSYGFYASEGPSVYRIPDGYFNIFNNTFHSTGDNVAFAFFGGNGGVKRLKNNIFVAPNSTQLASKGVALDSSNNIMVKDISMLKFMDLAGDSLQLQSGSPAIDSGEDLSSFGIESDRNGNLRTDGAFDIGAYEFMNP